MERAELEGLKSLTVDIKAALEKLKQQADKMSSCIKDGELVPENAAKSLEQALLVYQERIRRLRDIDTELSPDNCRTVAELEERIEAEEEALRHSAVREHVLDYFRLTAADESDRRILEESKMLLAERCRAAQGEIEGMKALVLVLEKAGDENSRLTDAEYDEIERAFKRPVARLVDRRALRVDPNFTLKAYLDNSCELLTADEAREPEQYDAEPEIVTENGESSASERDTPQPAPDSDAVEETVGVKEEKQTPGKTMEDRIFHIDYTDGVAVTFKDVPAASLGASKFINMARQRPQMALAIFFMAHHLLLEDSDLEDEEHHYSSPEAATREQLKKQGYLMELTLDAQGGSRSFLTLSSKGWACFSKKEVAKFLSTPSKDKISLMVPAKVRWSAADLTLSNVMRLVMLHDYFTKREYRQNYMVFPYGNDRFPIAEQFTDSDISMQVAAALFNREEERKCLAALQNAISELEPEDTMRIIVMSESDIRLLDQRLHNSYAMDGQVLYCLWSEPERLLDRNGKPVIAAQERGGEAEAEAEEPETEDTTEREKIEAQEVAIEEVPASEQADKPLSANANTAEHYRSKGWQLLRRGKVPEALAMFGALSRYSEELRTLYRRLAYALDDPALEKRYKYTELLSVFDEQPGELGYDALALAAYLRLFFSDDIHMEHYHVQDSVQTLNSNIVCREVPQLKDLAYELKSMIQDVGRGFDQTTLSALMDGKTKEEQIRLYQSRARSLLESRLEDTNISNRRVSGTRKRLFGSDSMLHAMLELACGGNSGDSRKVSSTLQQYLENAYTPGEVYGTDRLSESRIADFVDEAWASMAGESTRKQNDSLKGTGRTGIMSRVKDVVSICLTWASLTESFRASSLGSSEGRVRQHQAKAEKLLAESLQRTGYLAESVREEDAAYISVLRSTLVELKENLEGRLTPNRNRFYYISFLKGNFIELENYLPNMELDFDETAPFGLCKRIEEQSELADQPWDTVLKQIFEDPNAGRDYGHAMQIRDYLSENGDPFDWPANYDIVSNITSSRAALDAKDSEFLARLEMADNYGWVDDTATIYRITADMENRRKHCLESNNFGFYFRTMGAYLNRLERDALTNREPQERRLASLRVKVGSEYPVFREIERMLDEHMYTVAQDYMDRVEKEGLRELPENASLASENDTLTDFITHYNDYYKYARDAEHGKLHEAYGRRHRNVENSLVRTGYSMLEAWPRSPGAGAAMRDKLRRLFENMGLPVYDIEAKNNDHYFVTFAAQEASADYPHPIGAYGSEMLARGLPVFLFFGGKDAVTMNSAIRKVMTASVTGASLILTDTQLSLADKRKLAQTIKQENQNRNPYLILDRVTVLYLADKPQTERWNIFLKCALPFHYLNPFTENNAAEICPDMFIGRRQELEQVIAPGGANIIYGGRQLGKTALLHHARKLEDSRGNGKWSIFLDIKTCTAERAANRIYEKLQDEGFLAKDERTVDWNTLTRIITNRIKREKPKVERLLLLLDEADNFLADCQGQDYAPVVCLKQLQVDTENRFKFVLAGLHNVLRFSSNATDGNSVLPHLLPITIEPLPFQEASELLEKPLSYLGFKLKRENTSLMAQILSSTNYYPGLIQFYASRLVRSISQTNYGDANEKPPYWLREDQILTLLKNPDFLDNIREKFMITLGIDKNEKGYYKTLAYILAYCYFQYPEDTALGYTADQIKEMCQSFDIRSINELSLNQVRVLLEELIVLNVLRRNETDGKQHYQFNRTSFRHMLGNEDAVEEILMEIMEKEQLGCDA